MRESKAPGRWALALAVPGGHRYFRDLHHPGRVAIRDDSGQTPEATDDGVLHLDRSRPVEVGQGGCVIPLTDEAGVQRRAVGALGSWREGFLVAGHFGHRLVMEVLPWADPLKGGG
jgi:hypothetical protein